MKYGYIIFCLLLVTVSSNYNCAGTSTSGGGTTIKGKITNASDLRIFFDKLPLTKQRVEIIAQADVKSNGKFSIQTEKKVEPGVYRLRIGSNNLFLILEGNEPSVEITGALEDMSNGNMLIKGSEESVKVNKIVGKLNNKEIGITEIKQEIKNATNPLSAMLFAMGNINKTEEDIAILKNIVVNMRAKYPKSEYTTDLDNAATSLEKELIAQVEASNMSTGGAAPNISLPNPDGKVIDLNSLRGKVVLLDFWASWCGPCRRENPNVVNIYNKYKDQGFTVYSVSLDRPGGMENWKAAIAADKLSWPNHVSDLQGWQSAAGKLYGVDAIPRTFLLDKTGKVAGTNLRGEALEPAVKKLL